MPAKFLSEQGVVWLNEPVDSDKYRMLSKVLTGSYRKPFVIDDGKVRRLYFSLRFLQSEMLIRAPQEMRLAYTRKMMASLLFFSTPPREVLIIGLGGGSLTKYCIDALQSAQVTTVEIDPEVVEFGDLFGIPDDNARHRVVLADGRAFLESSSRQFDLILCDGCDGDGIAAGFCDDAFYRQTFEHLAPQGVLVVNLVGKREHADNNLRLLQAVFGNGLVIFDVKQDGNRVVYAFKEGGSNIDWAQVDQHALDLDSRHGMDFPGLARKIRRAHLTA